MFQQRVVHSYTEAMTTELVEESLTCATVVKEFFCATPDRSFSVKRRKSWVDTVAYLGATERTGMKPLKYVHHFVFAF